MKRFLLPLVAALCLSTAAHAADPEAAKGFIDSLAQQVLSIVKSDAIGQADKQQKIESLFSDKVDIDFVARFVLGKAARTATPQQLQAYVAAYKPFILTNYANKLTKYSGQTYLLKTPRADDDATVVPMVINDPEGQQINVDYRLAGSAPNFKIVDITVEGVSLLTTQRSEFSDVVANKGIDGLTEALKKQVAAKSAKG